MKLPIHLENRDQLGARIVSPSAGRNKEAIGALLADHLPKSAKVFEVASGSGEHGLHICQVRPDITWQPSDPDESSRESQNDWAKDRPGQILASLPINTMDMKWWNNLSDFDSIFCANMIHIAPWAAACGLAEGAKHVLKEGGAVFLYGPFLEGEETAQSNLEFDRNLSKRNPEWGVRKLSAVKHIFSEQGFNLSARFVMPKENRLLIFTNS